MPAHSPEELDSLLETAMAEGDIETLVGLYEPDAVFANAGAPLFTGHLELRAGFERMVVGTPIIRGKPRVISRIGHLAVMYNDWTSSGMDGEGKPFERSGKAIEVVRQQPDGTWRFVFDDPYGR